MPASKTKPTRRSPQPTVTVDTKDTILLAVTGMSPAVLTETVWALAQENPPVIPDRVVVVTTTAGENAIRKQLFGKDRIWHHLRSTILGNAADRDMRLDFAVSPDRIHVVHMRQGDRRVPLDRLETPDENYAFADRLTDVLYTYSSRPDTRIVASLAGGFKTMSALLLSCMQLLANPGDRVTHVLVREGYDATEPPFFFPGQPVRTLNRRDKSGTLDANCAGPHVRLIDVPVIPLRRWFEDVLGKPPGSYRKLVEAGAKATEDLSPITSLVVGPFSPDPADTDPWPWMCVNGEHIRLSKNQYLYLRFFAEQARDPKSYGKVPEAGGTLHEWAAGLTLPEPLREEANAITDRIKNPDTESVLSKVRNDLRRNLVQKGGAAKALAAAIPTRADVHLRVSASAIRFHPEFDATAHPARPNTRRTAKHG